MSTLMCLRGLPGSGKSTIAADMVANNDGIVRVNRDDLRRSVFGQDGVLSFDKEQTITKMQRSLAAEALAAGNDVVVDDMHLRPKYLREWNKFALEHGAEFTFKEVNTPVDVCVARDSARERKVGEKVIRALAEKYTRNGSFLPYAPVEPETVPSVEPYPNSPNLPHVIIVDVDGTMALMGDRSPYDWKAVSQDLPNWPVMYLVRRHLMGVRHSGFGNSPGQVLFVSGRDGSCRAETEQWLRKYLGQGYDHLWVLHMREAGDNRRDDIVKREIFDREIRNKYHVEFVLDDRNQVVRMWRSLGLPVFQVAEGDF